MLVTTRAGRRGCFYRFDDRFVRRPPTLGRRSVLHLTRFEIPQASEIRELVDIFVVRVFYLRRRLSLDRIKSPVRHYPFGSVLNCITPNSSKRPFRPRALVTQESLDSGAERADLLS
jgi:hypothetical protein